MKKTIDNSSFRPEQKLTISAYEYMLMNQAIDDAFSALEGAVIPKRYKFIDKDGEPVEKPTKEMVDSGEITQVFDVHATFHPQNGVEGFAGRITFPMVEAKRVAMDIHHREAEAGRTVLVEELMKEMKDAEEFNLKSTVDAE